MSDLTLSLAQFEHLREFVLENSGIETGDELSGLVVARLSRVASRASCDSFAELIERLERDPGSPLRDQVVEGMVSDETLWFRDRAPWRLLKNELLERYCREIASGERETVRIWCAACSTGQEAYSLAITALEKLEQLELPESTWDRFEIVASDISASALFIAMSGRYDRLSLSQGLPAVLRERYFEEDGRLWSIAHNIRERISFQKLGLLGSFEKLGRFDLVFCRNVLVYFSEATRSDVLNRIADSLTPAGTLVVGSTESLGTARERYERALFEDQAYYRKRAEEAA